MSSSNSETAISNLNFVYFSFYKGLPHLDSLVAADSETLPLELRNKFARICEDAMSAIKEIRGSLDKVMTSQMYALREEEKNLICALKSLS
ncbi:MAG: hypothetical protein AB7O60_03355 [Variibacter sp.]